MRRNALRAVLSVVVLFAGWCFCGWADAAVISPTDDAYVVNTAPSTPSPTETRVLTWTAYMSGGRGRSYLKFPVSGLPDASLLTSATLALYQYDAGGFVPWVNVYRVADDGWSETTLTWDTRPLPTPTSAQLMVRKNAGFGADWVSFDLLDTGTWAPGVDLSDGWLSVLIKSDESGDERHNFYSSNAASLHPQLELVFVPEPMTAGVLVICGGWFLMRRRVF